MVGKLGDFLQGYAKIRAGGDELIAKAIISAPPDKNLAITALNSYGGDANELLTFWAIPNMNLLANGNQKAGDISGALQICSTGFFGMSNAIGNTDANNRATPFAADNGRGSGMGTFPLYLLPAGYSLVAASFTANTATIYLSAGGFVCEGY